MKSDSILLYFGPEQAAPPDFVVRFSAGKGLNVETVPTAEGVGFRMNRAFPACLVLDGASGSEEIFSICASLKSDAFTSIVPVVILTPADGDEYAARGLSSGADEVITSAVSEREKQLRLELVLRRASRDVNVHPTTRLPGTVQIERDLADRLATGDRFAICYADLDHFKEFNDRYGYSNGDRVILLLSRILRDLVRGLAPGGFVGHIGGDDFIFNTPLEVMERCCDEILYLFDELIPYQYTEEDRKAGYFLGKDRRGSIHGVPLMTLSIGVVTNQFQEFTHTAQLSELAAEMKTYAKTLPGSVYVVDRRQVGTPRTD
jgi:GGDEF domain-containing protein